MRNRRPQLGADQLHLTIPDLCDQVAGQEISRREFLRATALLGVALPGAKALLNSLGGASDELPLISPATAEQMPKAGGVLRVASDVAEIADPANIRSIEASNMLRNSLEHLVGLDAQNVVRPLLAEAWQPNKDLTAWRFRLRPGVKWSNGDDFTTGDVAFNVERWTAAGSTSSMRSALRSLASFETHGPLDFTLHFSVPLLGVPEALTLSDAAILHRSFEKEGGDWTKRPIGTGPFALEAYAPGERCSFKRRDAYWGRPAFLDGVDYINVGPDTPTKLAALAGGKVDALHRIGIAELDAIAGLPGVKLLRARAANTVCIRMKPTERPFNDLRVRRAIVLAADNHAMLDIAIRGNGMLGENHHVASIHPEYTKLPPLKRDVARAKELLAQAEYPDGIDIELTLGNTQGRFEEETARVLQKSLAEAGIRLKLNMVPAEQYWPSWMKLPFSMTYWAHRPLGVTALDLAYRSGAAWNETGFADWEFDKAMDRALALVDPRKRALPIETCEKILQDACIMVQPFWLDEMTVVADKVRGLHAHPIDYYDLREVWIA